MTTYDNDTTLNINKDMVPRKSCMPIINHAASARVLKINKRTASYHQVSPKNSPKHSPKISIDIHNDIILMEQGQ